MWVLEPHGTREPRYGTGRIGVAPPRALGRLHPGAARTAPPRSPGGLLGSALPQGVGRHGAQAAAHRPRAAGGAGATHPRDAPAARRADRGRAFPGPADLGTPLRAPPRPAAGADRLPR